DGLGKLVARHLSGQQAEVLLHGRNKEKGIAVLKELESQTGNNHLKYYNGDYSSLREVKELAEEILKGQDHIDILINNAGVGAGMKTKKRELSRDGIELRLSVNYLAHALLTEKLLPLLKPGTSRIINVASAGQAPISFENLMLEKSYDGYLAYMRSKTALIMYTFDLAERLKDRGIKVNALHPASLMNTKMVLEDWDYTMSTVDQGAEAVEALIFVDLTGEYFDGKHTATAISQTYDPEARSKLSKVTMEILKEYLI
ncbi:MAG TPA: SDR family NAD(P)-dependent oxidoreductase, partial [Thermodesulfobacteriota bacterium]|nr:SDR family NAD(P)-dependent oxidoreductase [Thermodesulfobacteriota bacterium]